VNRLYLKKGRLPDPVKHNEVVINESFALAHRLNLGDRFAAIINGKWEELTITGVALSRNFVLICGRGDEPGLQTLRILWMGRKALGTSYAMDGAFNDCVLTSLPMPR